MWWKFKTPPSGRGLGGDPAPVLRARSSSSSSWPPTTRTPATRSSSTPRRRRSTCSTRAASSARSSTATATGSTWRRSSASTRRTRPSRSRSASSAAATSTSSGAGGRATSTWSARPRAAPSSCWAPTGSAATCSRASSTAPASRSPSGLVGISVSFVLGIILGGISGYYGGWIDNLIQRLIEIIRSFPMIPLWLSLSAALPVTWDPLWVFFGITLILGLVDWTGLARSVRSKVLSLREEEFAQAARLMGAGPVAHHRPPPDPLLHEPPDRLGHALDPRHDPGRDRALLPRPRRPARR